LTRTVAGFGLAGVEAVAFTPVAVERLVVGVEGEDGGGDELAHGVREHVIDQIMGWAPRTVRDRHYIRIAPQTMRDAILTLYQDDPICDPPQAPIEPPPPTTTIAEDLQRELRRLLEIERQLQRQHYP